MDGKLTREEWGRLDHTPLPVYGDRAEDYTGPHKFECSKRMCGHCECTCGRLGEQGGEA